MRTFVSFYAFCAVALLTGAGCDSATTPLPTAPGGPSIPAPVIPQGEITVQSVHPETGATLTAEECDGGWCVFDFKLAVDVRVDRDLAEPWVTVSFYDGLQQCAGSGYPTVYQTLEPLRANTTTRFTMDFLGLSNQTGTRCRLPDTTTTMVVQLWAERGRVGVLRQEFAHRYTFVLP